MARFPKAISGVTVDSTGTPVIVFEPGTIEELGKDEDGELLYGIRLTDAPVPSSNGTLGWYFSSASLPIEDSGGSKISVRLQAYVQKPKDDKGTVASVRLAGVSAAA